MHLLKEQIDLLASLLAGVAKNTDNIMAKQVATSSFGAQARGGERLRPSTAVTEAPLAKSVSVTSIIPKGAAKCRGLQNKIIISIEKKSQTSGLALNPRALMV